MLEIITEITNTFKEMDTTAINPYRDVVREMLITLPSLEGTEKQVAWAKQIRERCLVDTITEFCLAERKGTYGRKEFAKHTQEAIDFTSQLQLRNLQNIATNLSAKWWIDNRATLENPIPVGYYGDVESNGLVIKLNLQHWAQHKEKELNRLDIARETGETQIVLRRDYYIIKISPSGEIKLEAREEFIPVLSPWGGVVLK